ncbi:MAG TPA: dihydrofolate reductase [Polyangiaceae bacterium]
MRGSIWAESPERVIGLDGGIPWNHPGDQRRFKRVTLGTTIVMGRATFDSVGKPLPKRRNIVVTSRPLVMEAVETVCSVREAVERAGEETVWFIGGARIYEDAMPFVDLLDVTYVPEHVLAERAVHAPTIDEALFEAGPLLDHEDEPGLTRREYRRRPLRPRED